MSILFNSVIVLAILLLLFLGVSFFKRLVLLTGFCVLSLLLWYFLLFGLDFTFLPNVFLFIAWFMFLIWWVYHFFLASPKLGRAIVVILLFCLIWRLTKNPTSFSLQQAHISLHAVFSLVSYAVLAVAFLISCLLILQHHYLRQKQFSRVFYFPLFESSTGLLLLTVVGFLLLSFALGVGFLHIYDFSSSKQGWIKVSFSLLSWFVYAAMLLGYRWNKLQIISFAKGTIFAFVFLGIGFLYAKLPSNFLVAHQSVVNFLSK